MCKWLDQVTH